jgi:hypothetical protein
MRIVPGLKRDAEKLTSSAVCVKLQMRNSRLLISWRKLLKVRRIRQAASGDAWGEKESRTENAIA